MSPSEYRRQYNQRNTYDNRTLIMTKSLTSRQLYTYQHDNIKYSRMNEISAHPLLWVVETIRSNGKASEMAQSSKCTTSLSAMKQCYVTIRK